jgi:hypothetical protein
MEVRMKVLLKSAWGSGHRPKRKNASFATLAILVELIEWADKLLTE